MKSSQPDALQICTVETGTPVKSVHFTSICHKHFMRSSCHIRHASNLEILVELCLLFSDWELVTGEIQIENSQSLPQKANKSFFL